MITHKNISKQYPILKICNMNPGHEIELVSVEIPGNVQYSKL